MCRQTVLPIDVVPADFTRIRWQIVIDLQNMEIYQLGYITIEI